MELHSSHVLTDRIAHVEPCVAIPLALPIERVANIDRLRILAAIGVVWFHMQGAPHREIGYAGLPIFLLIFFSLITMRSHRDGTARFLKRRWNRLMVPWLFWSIVYGVCKFSKAMSATDMSSVRDMLHMESVLAGTHIHLWYLPYAFASGLLIYAINGWTSGVRNVVAALVAATLGVLALMGHATGVFGGNLMVPLPQWIYGLAAIFVGFAIGRCMMIPSRDTQRALLFVIALMVLAACSILNSMGFTSLAVSYGLGTVLVCIAYAWPSGNDAFVEHVAPLTLGIYLIHPLASYGLRHFVVPADHYTALLILTVCISGLVTLGLMKTPLRRFV